MSLGCRAMVPGFGVSAECQSIGTNGPWIKTVAVVYHIFDVSSSTGLGIEGCRTYWKDSPCHCPLLLANSTYALALDWDTKPAHHGLVRPDSRRQNLIFSTNRNILHTLKKEPLNIMLLHTSRTMDGPWTKTVLVVFRIFDVSSSTGLEIEGCRTCWKDE